MTRHPAARCLALLLAIVSALPRPTAAQAVRPATPPLSGTLRLPKLLSDHMVVQRDRPLRIWGWASPREAVVVRFRSHAARATAGPDGRWQVSLSPAAAGGPFTLDVRSGDRHLVVRDVLVGDVWLAGGQSNMEFPLRRDRDASTQIAGAHDFLLRQFKVPIAWSDSMPADVTGGDWESADSAHAGAFTAVGYYFARAIRRSEHVPIGIINSTWGGSAIETWLSQQANGLSDRAVAARRAAEGARVDSLRAALRATLGALPDSDAGLSDRRAPWASPSLDDAGWRDISVPAYWESQGLEGLDGVAWYRRSFTLDSAEARGGATLSFAAIDDDDITWVNGVEVGRTSGYDRPRSYRLRPDVLHAGRNLVAVRVTDGGGGGGINGAATLTLAAGRSQTLAGQWKFRIGKVAFVADGQRINKIPAVAYNSMIAPLASFAIRGVIWYQGESNANDAAQARAYAPQFASLIESWRELWGSSAAALPFLWVQLPNFGPPDSVPPSPAAAAWALQRESMDAALRLPNTGRAITIDVGGAEELHPRDKLDVGERLARVALAGTYHRPVAASGPTYRSFRIDGSHALVAFDHSGSGLRSRAADSTSVGAFAIAGADHRFVWATARIVGREVEVWSDAVRDPVAIRYAWANDPRGATLYNGDGLPAAPFRTDRW
jgi:sialate O-acetylesterase